MAKSPRPVGYKRAVVKKVIKKAPRKMIRATADFLRLETAGGVLLLVAAVIALIWANSPFSDTYFAARDYTFGFGLWNLSVGQWAADGLLAIFFFVVGLELKHEMVAGDLSDPKRVALPVAAAFGGVAVPAIIYTLVNWGQSENLAGWAIPTATDIAFAVAVLAIVAPKLPDAARLFLLTLAVVDDLIAIIIIAIFYSHGGHLIFLAYAAIPILIFAFLVQRYSQFFLEQAWAAWLILLPLGIIAWGLMFASGIHATIAGVILGFVVPARTPKGVSDDDPTLALGLQHRFGVVSAGFAVPVFAFFAAGVNVGGWSGLTSSLGDSVTLGIILGLVLGKLIGIFGTTFLLTKLSGGKMDSGVAWGDLVGLAILGGIGFTVSLLVGELSFGLGSAANDHAKVGVLMASLLAALVASVVLVPRNRYYLRHADESAES